MFAQKAIAAAIDAHPILEPGVSAAGRHDVDGAPQQGSAEAQRVAATVDLGEAGDQRVDGLAVAETVSLVEGQAVLGDQQAPIVVGVADARPADRDADIAAPLALGVDPGRVAQHVVECDGEALFVGLRRDHRHGAGGLGKTFARVANNRGIFGIASAGDDHSIDSCRRLGGKQAGRRKRG